jgi:DNA-directed RNA polymerase sigma subunit (sigma70/sigma32)
MKLNKDSAVERAKADLAERLNISADEVKEVSVSERDFPDMSLGAPIEDEMSAQMISSGWQINLEAGGEKYDYRADKYQLRLCGFRGTNYVIAS